MSRAAHHKGKVAVRARLFANLPWSRGATAGPLFQFLDAHVPIPNAQRFVLKGNETRVGAIRHFDVIKDRVDDLLPIEDDLHIAAFDGDGVAVPLADGFDHVFGRSNAVNDATTVMMTGFFEAIGIKDLHFEACFHRFIHVADAHENTAVALGIDLEFEIEHEVRVGLLGGKVGAPALPALFAFARL